MAGLQQILGAGFIAADEEARAALREFFEAVRDLDGEVELRRVALAFVEASKSAVGAGLSRAVKFGEGGKCDGGLGVRAAVNGK